MDREVRRARSAQETAVVVGVGSVGALASIRSLGRIGARVIAVHQTNRAIGFKSRFAEVWLSPDPRSDEAGFMTGAQVPVDGGWLTR